MKKSQLIIAAVLTLASVSARAQLASYQSTVNGQSPSYYFTFDNSSLSDSLGSGATFATGGTAPLPTAGPDYWGNANDAVAFPTNVAYLSIANSPSIIGGESASNGVGSLTMLFLTPASLPSTGYYFSDGDETGSAGLGQPADSAFALGWSTGAFVLKAKNQTIALPSVNASTWYYLALTYNLNGVATGVNGINYYLGPAGGSLASGFKQNGGSGNLSATATLGDTNSTFVVGNRQEAVTAATLAGGVTGGEIDELATWSNTELSSGQIASQYAALTIPEPSTCVMVGIGFLTLLGFRRKIRTHRQG